MQYSKSFDWWDWVRFQNLILPVSRWWENKSNIKSKNGFCGPSHPSLINNTKRRISSEISVPRFYWLIIIWRRGVSSDGWWPGAWCLVPGGFELWTLNIDLRIPPVPVPSSHPESHTQMHSKNSLLIFSFPRARHMTHIHFSENRCRPFMDQRINWFGGVSTPCLAKLFWFEAQVTADPLNHGPSPSDKLLFMLSPYPCCGRGPRMHGIRVEGRAYIAM